METKERLTRRVPFAVKAVDGETGVFEGYASIFHWEDSYGEVVEPGAFKKSLEHNASRIRVCYQHDSHNPIGIPEEIQEDGRGLHVKARISRTALGRDVITLLRDGVINEMSIGYNVLESREEEGVRYLEELQLWEVSLVTWGANEQALVTGVKERSAGIGVLEAEKAVETEKREADVVGAEKIGRVLSASTLGELKAVVKRLTDCLMILDTLMQEPSAEAEGGGAVYFYEGEEAKNVEVEKLAAAETSVAETSVSGKLAAAEIQASEEAAVTVEAARNVAAVENLKTALNALKTSLVGK